VPKVVAKDCEDSYECPAVRMQLGRGHFDLCKKSTLEPREGNAEFEPLEDSGIHKEEGLVKVRTIISANGNAFLARHNLEICVKFLLEDMKLILGLAFFVFLYVFKGLHLGGLS